MTLSRAFSKYLVHFFHTSCSFFYLLCVIVDFLKFSSNTFLTRNPKKLPTGCTFLLFVAQASTMLLQTTLSATYNPSFRKGTGNITGTKLKRTPSLQSLECSESLHKVDACPSPTKRKKPDISEVVKVKESKDLGSFESSMLTYFDSKSDKEYYRSHFLLQLTRRPQHWKYHSERSLRQRNYVINWQSKMGHLLGMCSEDIMSGICLLERLLSARDYCPQEAQKAAVACIMICSKMNDIQEISEKNIQFLFTQVDMLQANESIWKFTVDDIVESEAKVMRDLEYELFQPNTTTFMIMFLHELDIMNVEIYDLCCLIAETFVVEYSTMGYAYSTIAATVIKIALKSLKVNCRQGMFYDVFYTHPCPVDCLLDIKLCCGQSNGYTKELCSVYGHASTIPLDFEVG